MLVRVRRTESCSANKNPCYPATGEKQRHETDFEFAGEPFIRSYRSIGTFELGAMGARWSHSQGSRIVDPGYTVSPLAKSIWASR